MELKLPIKSDIFLTMRNRFIIPIRYVKWLANIVPLIKKNCYLRVCIDFRDLNASTTKDEYPMLVEEMLVNSETGFEYLSLLDGYSGYSQIFIAAENMAKIVF